MEACTAFSCSRRGCGGRVVLTQQLSPPELEQGAFAGKRALFQQSFTRIKPLTQPEAPQANCFGLVPGIPRGTAVGAWRPCVGRALWS